MVIKCPQCGKAQITKSGFDEDMQAIVTSARCPDGHSHGMDWRPVTKADISKYGLERIKESK